MKKLIVLAVSILFAISLSSCATTPTKEAQAEDTPTEVTPAEVTQAEETPAEVTPAEETQAKVKRKYKPRHKAPGSGPNPFSDCGIGAALFNNRHIQAWPLAITLNVFWDVGITGSTSAISSPETCTGPQVETAQLILETLPGLEKDIALGRGKHLSALHETLGCDIDRQGEINSSLRVSYADVVNDKSYERNSDIQRSSDLYDSVKEVTSFLKGSCKVAL